MWGENNIRIVGTPKLLVVLIGVITQENFLVRHSAGVELGNDGCGVGLGLGRDVGGGFVEPLFPKQRVKLLVAQVVRALHEDAPRRQRLDHLV